MTINMWTVACGIPTRPQFRALFVPWLERKGPTVLFCSRMERFSSSSQFPVRYIPDKSLRANGGALDGFSTDSSSEGKAPVRKPSWKGSSFRFDDGMHREDEFGKDEAALFSEVEELSHSIQPSREQRKSFEEFTQGSGVRQHKNICKMNTEVGSAMQDAENYVVGLLARKAYTAAELRKKLLGKKFSPETVDLVMTDIRSRGLINDSLYAETYSQSRWSSSSWGPRRIKQELFRKGVSQADAENAVKVVFQDGESGHQESVLGMSQNARDQLVAQASKKWLQSRDKPEDKRKARIVRWLQYRGHNWSVTSFVLKQLQSLHPP